MMATQKPTTVKELPISVQGEIDHLVTKSEQLGAPETDSRVDTVEFFCFLGTIITQNLKCKCKCSHQKSTVEDVFPAAAEEIQPAKDNDGAHLNHHH